MNLHTGTFGRVETPLHLSLISTVRHAPHDVQARLRERGEAVFPVFELKKGLEAAVRFREAVVDARASQGPWGACLDVHDEEAYAAMRLFVDATWQAGFAMRGRELLSGFNHRSNPRRDVLANFMEVGISLGGDRGNAFDTVLPRLYAKGGLIEVARMAWSDEEAPNDWDYVATCAYNGGRPDVVFMLHNPGPVVSQTVLTFADGLAVQDAVAGLKSMGGRA